MEPRALNGRHLEVFVAMMKSRNQAEAALKLGISTPAVSKTLRLMEQEIGLPLFKIERGRLQPTVHADRLLPLAQKAVRQFTVAKEAAYALGSQAGRPLVIATHLQPLLAFVSQAVHGLKARRPELRIDIHVESPAEVLRQVQHHEADVGITHPPSIDASFGGEFVRRSAVTEDLLVAVLRKDHRLASRPTVRPADLEHEHIVSLPADSPTTALIDATLKEAGTAINATVTVNSSVSVCSLVSQGLGVGLINPVLSSPALFPDVVYRPFRPRVAMVTEIVTSTLRPLSDEAQELVEGLQATAAEMKRRLSRG